MVRSVNVHENASKLNAVPENFIGKHSHHEKKLQWDRNTPRKLGNVEFGGSQVLQK